MTSAHIYRDALHIDDKRMDSTSLLIPKGGSVPWLEVPVDPSGRAVSYPGQRSCHL